MRVYVLKCARASLALALSRSLSPFLALPGSLTRSLFVCVFVCVFVQRTKEKVEDLEFQNKELRTKLAEMMTAIKQLKAELTSNITDKEAAEAHLAQMANPEREAYMHKYALEKLKEEFEKYKKDVIEKEANVKRDVRRLQENLANRSSADDAAKAAMNAEIRELKSKRGLMQFFDGQVHAPAAPADSGHERRSPKGGKKSSPDGAKKQGSPKGSKYPVADFDPSSGLKPKTEQVARAAGVVVETNGNDEVLDTKNEALAKRKEAAARTGREFLVAQVYDYMYMYIYLSVGIYIYIYIYICLYINVYKLYIYIYTYEYVYIYIYV